MKITTGDLDMMTNGVIFSKPQSDVIFDLDPELKVVMKFVSDPLNPGIKSDFSTTGPNSGLFTLTNYNSVFGIGFPEPRKIGNIGATDIFIAFFIYHLHESSLGKKIEYTFYSKKNGN